MPYKIVNEKANTTKDKKMIDMWTCLDGSSSNNAPKSNKHWDSNTKFLEPPAIYLAIKHSKNLQRTKRCSPSNDIKIVKSSKIYKTSKGSLPSTSTSSSFHLEKIMSSIEETHTFMA